MPEKKKKKILQNPLILLLKFKKGDIYFNLTLNRNIINYHF